jgi:hypothetical protein
LHNEEESYTRLIHCCQHFKNVKIWRKIIIENFKVTGVCQACSTGIKVASSAHSMILSALENASN